MKRRSAWIIVPVFVLVTVFFFLISTHSRKVVERHVLEQAGAEGETLRTLLLAVGEHLLAGGQESLQALLPQLLDNPDVIYVALVRDRRLVFADSKFEGYLPIDRGAADGLHTFPSPLGEVFEVVQTMRDAGGGVYTVHIGYFFTSIDAVRASMKRNFLLLAILQGGLLLIVLLILARITRRLLRQELHLEQRRAEAEYLRETAFLVNAVNHEIRNPLHSLYLNIQMLEPQISDCGGEAREHVAGLKKELRRLTAIMDRFSTLFRQIHVKRESVPLADFLKENHALLQGLAPQSRLDIPADDPLQAQADPDLLKQILINLVKNAGEAGAKQISISIAPAGKRIQLSVQDDGPGMDEERLSQLFSPWFSGRMDGSGIGLTLSRRLARAMGGDLTVDSRPGSGTRFTITL